MKKTPKYKEIFKLKKMLEDVHIPFEFIDEAGLYEIGERYQICYPVFNTTKRKLSAIQGFGTYGEEQDLIEIMGLLTPEEGAITDVTGYLTAKDVFERIKNDYYGGIKGMKKVKVIDEDTLEIKEVVVDEDEEINQDIWNQLRTALNCEPEEFSKKYEAYKKAEAEFDAIYIPFKTKLIKIFENHSDLPKNIIVGGTKLTYVSANTRHTIDNKKLKEEEPELAKKYTKEINVAATIRIDDK